METENGAAYDHIVPLVGYTERRGSQVELLFNDLHAATPLSRLPIADRVDCRAALPWDKRFAYCLPSAVNYGYRVHGNADAAHELLPLRLEMDDWYEPDYSREDAKGEAPKMLEAWLRVSGLQRGATYALLRYDHAAKVPHEGFLSAGGWSERSDFAMRHAPTAEWRVQFWSNSTQLFRCVRAT